MARVQQMSIDLPEQQLQEDDVLWRYVPLAALFSYLRGSLFIPSVAKLKEGDPFEGEFYSGQDWFNLALRTHCGTAHKSVLEWIHEKLCNDDEREMIAAHSAINRPAYKFPVYQRRYLEFSRHTRFAWCWFQSPIESSAMWHIYGKGGAAVATTVGKLKSALEGLQHEDRLFVFRRMRYVQPIGGDQALNFSQNNPDYTRLLLQPHFLKRLEYKFESEVRFVTAGPNTKAPGITFEDVNPVCWIERIRLCPRLNSSEVKAIHDAVKHLLPGVDCAKSDLLAKKSGDDTSDHTLSAELQRSREEKWRDGKDGIPSVVKKLV